MCWPSLGAGQEPMLAIRQGYSAWAPEPDTILLSWVGLRDHRSGVNKDTICASHVDIERGDALASFFLLRFTGTAQPLGKTAQNSDLPYSRA